MAAYVFRRARGRASEIRRERARSSGVAGVVCTTALQMRRSGHILPWTAGAILVYEIRLNPRLHAPPPRDAGAVPRRERVNKYVQRANFISAVLSFET